MAYETWKGYGQSSVSVVAAATAVKHTIPDGDRAFICSVDNEGTGKVFAKINTEVADFDETVAIPIRSDKAYTWYSKTENQRITSVTIYSTDGSTVNIAFS